MLHKIGDSSQISYGYFVGRSRYDVYKLKTALQESQLNPIIIKDADREGAIFAKVLSIEAESFNKMTQEFNFKQVKLSKNSVDEVKWVFGDGWPTVRRTSPKQ